MLLYLRRLCVCVTLQEEAETLLLTVSIGLLTVSRHRHDLPVKHKQSDLDWARFLQFANYLHCGSVLTMRVIFTMSGGFWLWRGVTHNGRFLTMRWGVLLVVRGFWPRIVVTHYERFLTLSGVLLTTEGFWPWVGECYSPWEVPDHDGRTELGFLQFADRLHGVPERRLRPTVIYNTKHYVLIGRSGRFVFTRMCWFATRDGSCFTLSGVFSLPEVDLWYVWQFCTNYGTI